jgi:hypothetical protein
MRYAHFYTSFLVLVYHTSCGQSQTNSPTEKTKSESKDIVTSHQSNDPNFHTQYEYTDSIGKSLVIQNSFPRGELYTGPNGQEYVKKIFWTRIINETDNSLELTIDFSGDPYEIPGSGESSVSRYFKILIHPDTMTRDKDGLFNHGLRDLDSFLANGLDKPSSLKRTIPSKESSGFYVVRLAIVTKSDKEGVKAGGSGVTRAGFSLKGQNLFFTLNGKEFHCGKVNLKNLTLTKQRTTGV